MATVTERHRTHQQIVRKRVQPPDPTVPPAHAANEQSGNPDSSISQDSSHHYDTNGPAVPAASPASFPTKEDPPHEGEQEKTQVALTPDERARLAEGQAAAIALNLFPMSLLSALGLQTVELAAAQLFLDKFRRDAGDPTDSIERSLVDRIAMTHFFIGVLQANSHDVPDVVTKQLCLSYAARFNTELCRMIESLTKYRTGQQRLKIRAAKETSIAQRKKREKLKSSATPKGQQPTAK